MTLAYSFLIKTKTYPPLYYITALTEIEGTCTKRWNQLQELEPNQQRCRGEKENNCLTARKHGLCTFTEACILLLTCSLSWTCLGSTKIAQGYIASLNISH